MARSKSGDWVFTLKDGTLTMRRTERETGFSETTTYKGSFDFDGFSHIPTANITIELAYYWSINFRPLKGSKGQWYNPFTDVYDNKTGLVYYSGKVEDGRWRPEDSLRIGDAMYDLWREYDKAV